MSRTSWRLVALLALVLVVMAACGSSGTASGSTSPAATVPPASVATGGAAGSCPANSGLPANVNVHGTAVASGTHLSLQASDFFFSPTCVSGVPSGMITLTVHNAGVTLHNVSIPSLHIDMDMAPGQTITVHVMMGSKPLVFFCKYHQGSGMLGALLPAGS